MCGAVSGNLEPRIDRNDSRPVRSGLMRKSADPLDRRVKLLWDVSLYLGPWDLGSGSWVLDPGEIPGYLESWVLDLGLGSRFWVLGSWVWDLGSGSSALGPGSGTWV